LTAFSEHHLLKGYAAHALAGGHWTKSAGQSRRSRHLKRKSPALAAGLFVCPDNNGRAPHPISPHEPRLQGRRALSGQVCYFPCAGVQEYAKVSKGRCPSSLRRTMRAETSLATAKQSSSRSNKCVPSTSWCQRGSGEGCMLGLTAINIVTTKTYFI